MAGPCSSELGDLEEIRRRQGPLPAGLWGRGAGGGLGCPDFVLRFPESQMTLDVARDHCRCGRWAGWAACCCKAWRESKGGSERLRNRLGVGAGRAPSPGEHGLWPLPRLCSPTAPGPRGCLAGLQTGSVPCRTRSSPSLKCPPLVPTCLGAPRPQIPTPSPWPISFDPPEKPLGE